MNFKGRKLAILILIFVFDDFDQLIGLFEKESDLCLD